MAVDDCHLAVLDIYEVVGVVDDGCGVGAEEVFAIADAYDHRAALARCYDFVRVVLFEDCDCICAHNLLEGHPDRFFEGASVGVADIFDEVDKHLGVGVAAEGVSVGDERVLDDTVVLDDAVVDECDFTGLGEMGMGIDIVRDSVGGPAGVGDSDCACCIFIHKIIFKIRHFSFAFIDIEASALVDKSQTCAVISTIFESVKAFKQYRSGFLPAYISYNSAHLF